jgi:hypothetical protein
MAKTAWYMRGGVSMWELLELPQRDYKYFNEVIEENIDLSKKINQLIL